MKLEIVLIRVSIFFCLAFTLHLVTATSLFADISGKVTDAETGEPLFYVNVYPANTTIGTTTNHAGDFVMHNIPPGEYQLVIHHIGYRVETRPVDTIVRVNYEFNINLIPAPISGESVEVVAPDAKEWRKYLKEFEREFIGTSANAKACEILNPEVLDLWIDPNSKDLLAATDSALHVTNHALGYRVHIVLLDFKYDYTNRMVRFQVLPRFEDMVLTDSSSSGQWQENRRRTLAGSLRHFLTAVAHNRLHEEGFQVKLVQEIGSQLQLNWVGGEDLICTYGSTMYLFFSGPLYVGYKNQQSWIELQNGAVSIDTLGNSPGRQAAITCYGDWAKHRFAECLPFDYQPQDQ